MDITEAVKLAKSHIDAHPDFAGMSPRRLEEAELGEDTNNWLVTISIVRQGGHEGHGSHEQNRQVSMPKCGHLCRHQRRHPSIFS